MTQFKKVVDESFPGEFWGLKFPHTPEQLKEMGPEWLTEAMHTCGTLPKDNKIVSFAEFEVKCSDTMVVASQEDNNWGGACIKILLTVEYEKDPGPDLSKHMFVKVPHEFTGKNERFRLSVSGSDFPEVMFYNVLGGRLPIRTPKGYFCDMSRKSTNFILVCERIPYGPFAEWEKEYAPGEMLPAPGKYRDWAVPCAEDMYYAHARTMAQFFAWGTKARKDSSQMDMCFIDEGSAGWRIGLYPKISPMSADERDNWFHSGLNDPQLLPLILSQGFNQSTCEGFMSLGEDLVRKTAAHVIAPELAEKTFLDKLFSEARDMSYYVSEMAFYTMMMPEYFALTHPNAQVDNAFYWQDDKKAMQCGLLDFGGLSHGSIPDCVANGWIGAEPDMMDEHEEKLTKFFCDEYEKASGVKLDYDDFYLHLKLAHGRVFYGCCANARWLKQMIKPEEWADITSRKDSAIDDLFLARCYFVQVEMFLGMWKKRSPIPHWRKWMKRMRMPRKHPS